MGQMCMTDAGKGERRKLMSHDRSLEHGHGKMFVQSAVIMVRSKANIGGNA